MARARGDAAVLDILAHADIKATFFVLARSSPIRASRLAKRAHAEGHWIAITRGRTRNRLAAYRPGARVAEIIDTEAAINELAHPEHLFRLLRRGAIGQHLLSAAAVGVLCKGKHDLLLWNAIPRLEDPRGWRDALAHACTAWTLLVLHDLPTARWGAFASSSTGARSRRALPQDFPPECVPIRPARWSRRSRPTSRRSFTCGRRVFVPGRVSLWS